MLQAGVDEGFEQGLVLRVEFMLNQTLGMPLHSNKIGMIRLFEAFYDSVGRPCGNGEAGSDVLYSLVMERIRRDFCRAVDLGEL